MFACTLNTNPENGESSGRFSPEVSARGDGLGTSSMTESRRSRTPKLVSAEPKNIGVVSPSRNISRSCSAPESSSSSSKLSVHDSPSSTSARSAGTISSGASVDPRAVRVNRMKSPLLRSTTPRKSPAMPTGQVIGVQIRPSFDSMSSMSSSGLNPGRSHLLT
ncbi:unannotated protein [freshwater metagenome]|uniref:Unannotated protein n=1 Tax=freshwater metagenome TaxID=449393 RepID=A0A6J7UTM6_9ZZZZ